MAKSFKDKVWENMQLVCLALTIVGQIVIGPMYLLGQGVWLVSNVIRLVRDFILHRPIADKITDAMMTAITIGLIIVFLIV